MITIQRVRVVWSAAGRGAPQADARRGLDRPLPLPAALPHGAVVIHDVLADEATGYARDFVAAEPDRDVDLRTHLYGGTRRT